jgi:hypothetical protein
MLDNIENWEKKKKEGSSMRRVRETMEDVQSFVPLFGENDSTSPLLSFGVPPTKYDLAILQKHGVDTIIDIREEIAWTYWYVGQLPATCKVISMPLERFSDDGRQEALEPSDERALDKKVLDACMKIVLMLRHEKKRIFIHGYNIYSYAYMVPLIVWYLYKNDRSFDPHAAMIPILDCPYVIRDFQQCVPQLNRILAKERKSIMFSFARDIERRSAKKPKN